MMRFAALNRQESSGDSFLASPAGKRGKPTREAQESACLQLYHAAMKKHQEGSLEESRVLYCDILNSPLLSEIAPPTEGAGQGSTLHRLKFLILKNLATIAKESNDTATAISAYIEASSLDRSDTTMWYHLGLAASSVGDLLLARGALEQSLSCNHRYWPAINHLLVVLMALEDSNACLQVAAASLELDPNYSKGLSLLQQILQTHPDLGLMYQGLTIHLLKPSPPLPDEFVQAVSQLQSKHRALNSIIVMDDCIYPSTKLTSLSLHSLGKFLITLYQSCKHQQQKGQPGLSLCVGLYTVLDEVGGLLLSPVKKGAPLPQFTSPIKPTKAAGSADGGQIPTSCGEEGPAKKEGRKRVPSDNGDSAAACAPKRRSNRVKSRSTFKDHNDLFAVFHKYIPTSFRLFEIPDLTDLSMNLVGMETDSSPPNSDSHVEQTRSTSCVVVDDIDVLPEAETVRSFIEQHQTNSGTLHLLTDYLSYLANHYDSKWSQTNSPMGAIYMRCHELLFKHIQLPSLLDLTDPVDRAYAKKLFMITLCYLELAVDSLSNTSGSSGARSKSASGGSDGNSLPNVSECFSSCWAFTAGFPLGLIDDQAQRKASAVRVEWLRVRWMLLQARNQEAILFLNRCKEALVKREYLNEEEMGDEKERSIEICLVNCKEDQVISIGNIEEKTRHLEQALSLSRVQQYHEDCDYDKVVDLLLPILHQDAGAFMELVIGSERPAARVALFSISETPPTGLRLLLFALEKTGKTLECLQTCCKVLVELMLHGNMTHQWALAFSITFKSIENCLTQYPSTLASIPCCLAKHLTVCIMKAVEVMSDAADSSIHLYLPVCLPWKLFHIISSHEDWWENELDQEDPLPSLSPTPPSSSSPPVTTGIDTQPEEPMEIENQQQQQLHVLPSSPKENKDQQQPQEPSSPPRKKSLSPFVATASSPLERKQRNLHYLMMAHSQLSSMNWCTRDAGSFLLYIVNILRSELRSLTALPPDLRQVLLLELEQCYCCLYGYPHRKKAKAWNLQEHNADQVALTWDGVLMLLEHYRPSHLPTIDDTKSTISAEMISLYKRIIAVIPSDIGQVVSVKTLTDYVSSSIMFLPPGRPSHQHSSLVAEIYYLLADDCLRSTEHDNAIKYYLLNLSHCPSRFDSWAGMALAKSRKVTDMLNKKEKKSSAGSCKFVQDNTSGTLRCFKKAVSLNSNHCYITEKFGFFCYTLQAFTSQLQQLPKLCSQQQWVISLGQEMLQLAWDQFNRALSLGITKHAEPWIYHFMLGKISWKQKRPVADTLHHLVESAIILCNDKAAYPSVVDYSTKGHAVEAIEVHYQLFSIALKQLLLHKCLIHQEREEDEVAKKREQVVGAIKAMLIELKVVPLARASYPILRRWARDVVQQAMGKTVPSREYVLELGSTSNTTITSNTSTSSNTTIASDNTTALNTTTTTLNTTTALNNTTTVSFSTGLSSVTTAISAIPDTIVSKCLPVSSELTSSVTFFDSVLVGTKPVSIEPVVSAAVTSESASSMLVTSEPMDIPPVASKPVVSTAVTSEPVVSTAVASEPMDIPPVASKPVVSAAVTSESASSMLVTSEPMDIPPVASKPVVSTAVTSEPVVSTAVASEPMDIPPVASKPVVSAAVTSESASSMLVTSEPVVSTAVASEPVVGTAVTSESASSMLVTTEPMDIPPVTSEPVVSTAVTSEPVVSTAVASEPVVSAAVISEPVVSTAVISEPVVSAAVISEPVVSTAVTSEPVVSTAVASEPVVSAAVISEPVVSTAVTSEPVVSTAVASEPVVSAAVISEPVVSTAVTSEPVVSTAVASEPVVSAAVISEPVVSTAVTSEPVVSTAVASEPVVSAAVISEPVVSTAVASEPVVSAAVASEPVVSAAVTSESASSMLVTSEPVVSAAVASEPVVSAAVASEPVVSAAVASEPVVSTAVASEPVVGTAVTSESASSMLVTTEPMDIPPVTSEPVVSTAVTSEPVVSTAVASEPVVSAAVISEPVVSTAVISEPVVSAAVTSESASSMLVTSEPMDIPPVASEPVVSTAVASEPVVSTAVTSESASSMLVTSEPMDIPPVASEPVVSAAVTSEPVVSTAVASEPVASTSESISIVPPVPTVSTIPVASVPPVPTVSTIPVASVPPVPTVSTIPVASVQPVVEATSDDPLVMLAAASSPVCESQSSSISDAVIVCMEEEKEEEEMDVFSSRGSEDGDMGAVERIAAAENSPEDSTADEVPDEEAVFQHCLYGVMVCAVRCPAYSKPLYRLAATAANLGLLKMARSLLLGPIPEPLSHKQEKLLPLLRVKSNMFQNLWQIPVDEINRPGSFSSHVRRCVSLLLSVLSQLRELNTLLQVAQLLKHKPELNRQYMRETERPLMYSQTLHCCSEVLEYLTDEITSSVIVGKASDEQITLLSEGYSFRNMLSSLRSDVNHQKLLKVVDSCLLKLFSLIWKDPETQSLLVTAEENQPLEPSLELALKYCFIKSKS